MQNYDKLVLARHLNRCRRQYEHLLSAERTRTDHMGTIISNPALVDAYEDAILDIDRIASMFEISSTDEL